MQKILNNFAAINLALKPSLLNSLVYRSAYKFAGLFLLASITLHSNSINAEQTAAEAASVDSESASIDLETIQRESIQAAATEQQSLKPIIKPIAAEPLLNKQELPNQITLPIARQQYQEAISLLNAKKLSGFRSLRKQLDNYPLAGHLDYLYHRKYISKLDAQTLTDFDQQHQNPVLSKKLKRTWLKKLAKQKDWTGLLKYYDPALANTALQCQHAQALFNGGQAEAAFEQAKTLWLSAKSRPKSCDAIFHLLVKNNQVDSDLAWQRFALAFGERQIQLAKYLTRFLDTERANTAALYLKLYRSPADIPQRWVDLKVLSSGAQIANAEMHSAKLQLLKRLARADAEQAVDFSLVLSDNKNKDANSETQQLVAELNTYIITRHALKDYQSLPGLYQQLGSPQDKSSLEWLLRSYIATAQWQQLPSAIEQLPDELKQHERWQYWSARAKALSGESETSTRSKELSLETGEAEPAPSKSITQQLAEKASFYGFLSAEQLQQPYSFEPVFHDTDSASINKLKYNPTIQRAIEHFMQNDYAMARSEWRQVSKTLKQSELIDAAYLAREFGWHNQAIVSAIATKSWQHYPLRFPDIYTDRFEQQSERYNTPAQWLYATARQESAFASDARSGAGAMGLMQLLPSTAKDTARKVGVKYQRNRLNDPEYNIVLGSYYLSAMHTEFGNRALASAAYNAGPHRVKKWLKNLTQDIPVDAWIETIRFSETRQYVQNIFSFSLIHSLLYDKQGKALNMVEREAASINRKENTSLASSTEQIPFILQHENIVKPYEQQLQQAKVLYAKIKQDKSQQLLLSQLNQTAISTTATATTQLDAKPVPNSQFVNDRIND